MPHLKPGDPFLEVLNSPDDPYTFTVRHANHEDFPHVETVDTGPNPTWPSPVEVNDAIGDAVVKVLDAAWKVATGQEIERDPREIGRTYANQKHYLTDALNRLSRDDLIEVMSTALMQRDDIEYTGRGGFDNWYVEGTGDNWEVAINPATH